MKKFNDLKINDSIFLVDLTLLESTHEKNKIFSEFKANHLRINQIQLNTDSGVVQYRAESVYASSPKEKVVISFSPYKDDFIHFSKGRVIFLKNEISIYDSIKARLEDVFSDSYKLLKAAVQADVQRGSSQGELKLPSSLQQADKIVEEKTPTDAVAIE